MTWVFESDTTKCQEQQLIETPNSSFDRRVSFLFDQTFSSQIVMKFGLPNGTVTNAALHKSPLTRKETAVSNCITTARNVTAEICIEVTPFQECMHWAQREI